MSILTRPFCGVASHTMERVLVQELGKRLDEAPTISCPMFYRAACVKEFELILEQSGKLLRKRLAAFFASNRQADRLATSRISSAMLPGTG